MSKVRQMENLHILLWLFKDTCWMLQWKIPGMIMIFPTVGVAAFLTYTTRKRNEFYINLAILLWILANSYWMCCEFTGHEDIKNYAGIPFSFGIAATLIFYIRRFRLTSQMAEKQSPVKEPGQTLN